MPEEGTYDARLFGLPPSTPPKTSEKEDPFEKTLKLANDAAKLRIIEQVGHPQYKEPPAAPAPAPPPGPKQDEKTTLAIAGIVKSQNELIMGMQAKIVDPITN